MDTQLPPLGIRGWSPADLDGLPALPEALVWGGPLYDYQRTANQAGIWYQSQRVALVSPLVTGTGWVAHIGTHREGIERRHHIWTKTFDRSVDYVVGWVRKYAPAIRDEVDAYQRERTANNPYRVSP
ncbi:hypothetical protein [Lysobacter enzymogenes]|uniref:hypothetical protein n=1 Tax=Lysobacter enzymogenes TaxID=69 RepID=UPI0009C5D1BC|nr:hypothetical protein [Lysobacter enzymogenes]UZW62772.1 hypothetical protein BV903_010960 [Lysobacter enzymogenes]